MIRTTNAALKLDEVDRTEFSVSARDGRVLTAPRKSKFRWLSAEYGARSLLTDAAGNVVSAGFPKFFNLGEDATYDASFRQALSAGAVTFTDKADGTLVIVDRIDGEPHFRTRGNHDLGVFSEPVMALVRERYPALLEWATRRTMADHWSLLLEYTAPDNRIVVAYSEARLTLLGAVDKRTLNPIIDAAPLAMVASTIGVGMVGAYNRESAEDLLRSVRGWKDGEGVVARWHDPDLGPCLLKVKSDWYVALHALRFRLSDARLRKFCFLRGIHTEGDFVDALAEMGYDFEAMEFFRQPFAEYAHRRASLLFAFRPFVGDACMREQPDEGRRAFVERTRAYIAQFDLPPEFFGAVMCVANGKDEDAMLAVEALALEEPVNTVRQWVRNRDAELAAILKADVGDDG
jgi:hypothetical protein